MEWLPIESAPKDGSDVLLYLPDGHRKIRFGRYYDSQRIDFGKVVSDTKGWRCIDAFGDVNSEQFPTHWLRLPSVPT